MYVMSRKLCHLTFSVYYVKKMQSFCDPGYVNLYILSEYNVGYLRASWKVKLAYFFIVYFIIIAYMIHLSIHCWLAGGVFVLSFIMDEIVFSILT
jgi:hypothetical protein